MYGAGFRVCGARFMDVYARELDAVDVVLLLHDGVAVGEQRADVHAGGRELHGALAGVDQAGAEVLSANLSDEVADLKGRGGWGIQGFRVTGLYERCVGWTEENK